MTGRSLLLLLLMSLAQSCYFPAYLPKAGELNSNTHGAYVMVSHKKVGSVKGELIAVDDKEMIVLSDDKKKCNRLSLAEIRRFKVVYAEPRHYGWTIPVFTLATISHGAWAIFTMPFNLIYTISLTGSAENAFTYQKDDITYEKLRMFARFPQGIPSGIDLLQIK